MTFKALILCEKTGAMVNTGLITSPPEVILMLMHEPEKYYDLADCPACHQSHRWYLKTAKIADSM